MSRFSLFSPRLVDIAPTDSSGAREDGADEIYARRMRSVLRGGYPIRNASPFVSWDGIVEEVRIGDVCYVLEGTLRRIWNIIWPEDDPDWRKPASDICPSFRSEHPSFYASMSMRLGRPTQELAPGYHVSKGSTKREVKVGASAPIVPSSPGATISLSLDKREGAVLLLQQDAERQSIAADSLLRRYILRHAQDIDQFVQSLSLRATMHDLIFITGHVKTATWDTWTFRESSGDNSISFEAGASCMANASVAYSRSYHTESSPAHAWGPQGASPSSQSDSAPDVSPNPPMARASSVYGRSRIAAAAHPEMPSVSSIPGSLSSLDARVVPYNQCLLVSGYKFKQRMLRIPDKLRASAGPHNLPGFEDERGGLPIPSSDPEGGSEDDGLGIPVHHALDVLMDYMLKTCDDVDFVVTHDDDLRTLFWDRDGIPEDLETALQEMKPHVFVDEQHVGSLVFNRQVKYAVTELFPPISASESLKGKLYTRLASSKDISFDHAVEVTSPDEADVVLIAEPTGSRLEWPRLCCKGDLLTDDEAFTAKLNNLVTFHAGLMLKNSAHPLTHAVSVEFQLEGCPSIPPSQRRDRSRMSKGSPSAPVVDVVQLGGLERVKLVIHNQSHLTLYFHVAFLDIAATRIISLWFMHAPHTGVVLPGCSLDLRRSDAALGGRPLAELLQPGRTYILKVFLSTRPFDTRWLAPSSDQCCISADVPPIAVSGIWDTVEQRIHIAQRFPHSALPGGTDRKAQTLSPPHLTPFEPLQLLAAASEVSAIPSNERLLPMIKCQYDGCTDFFPLDFVAMQAHLRVHFALKPLPAGAPRFCEWAGCRCGQSATPGNRCGGLAPMHPAHVKDMLQHVWDSHLGLRYVCSRCGRADFTSERSMLRHHNGAACPGPVPEPTNPFAVLVKGSSPRFRGDPGSQKSLTVAVMCPHCKLPWPSQTDMNQHMSFCSMNRSV